MTIQRWYTAVLVISSKVAGQASVVREDPGSYIVAKERLTVFWTESNKHKTATEILDELEAE